MRETNIKLVTFAMFVATFMTAIEGTIVTTAMPTIIGSLHGIEIMNWVFSIYLLTSAMLTPIYGKLSDRVGRKPIFIIGTAIFIIGSALCGLSTNMLTLIIARGIQGMGAGAMLPVSLTIIADMYPPEERAKIIGLTSTAWGIASVVGPLAGGLIVDTIGWGWIFFINVPIGLFLIGMISRYLIEDKRNIDNGKIDILGSLTLMTVLMTMLISFQIISEDGLTILPLILLVISLLIFIAFIKIEQKATDPVIPLSLFSSKLFVVVNLVASLISGFLMSLDVYIPMWMQGVLGYKAGIGGMVLAPMSILWILGSALASRFLASKSIKWVLMVSLTLVLIGAVSLVLIPAQTPFILFVLISSLLGIGLGSTIVATTVSSQISVPQSDLGVASSFNTLARTIGQTLMIAVFGIIMNTISENRLKAAGFKDKDILNKLVNPQTAKNIPSDMLKPLRNILYEGIHSIFIVGIILIFLSMITVQLIKKSDEKIYD